MRSAGTSSRASVISTRVSLRRICSKRSNSKLDSEKVIGGLPHAFGSFRTRRVLTGGDFRRRLRAGARVGREAPPQLFGDGDGLERVAADGDEDEVRVGDQLVRAVAPHLE